MPEHTNLGWRKYWCRRFAVVRESENRWVEAGQRERGWGEVVGRDCHSRVD